MYNKIIPNEHDTFAPSLKPKKSKQIGFNMIIITLLGIKICFPHQVHRQQ